MADIPLGRFCWFDLMTTDPDAAPAFYGQVAGWGTTQWDEGEKPYTMWTNGTVPIGGVMRLPDQAAEAGAPRTGSPTSRRRASTRRSRRPSRWGARS